MFRTILYESIPVAMLTSQKHEEAAIQVDNALEKFRQCSHISGPSCAGFEDVCDDCASDLAKVAFRIGKYVGTTSRVLLAIVEAQREGKNAPIRTLASFVSALLKKSLNVLAGYRSIYYSNMTRSAIEYNRHHQCLDGSSSTCPTIVTNPSDSSSDDDGGAVLGEDGDAAQPATAQNNDEQATPAVTDTQPQNEALKMAMKAMLKARHKY